MAEPNSGSGTGLGDSTLSMKHTDGLMSDPGGSGIQQIELTNRLAVSRSGAEDKVPDGSRQRNNGCAATPAGVECQLLMAMASRIDAKGAFKG